VLFILAVRSVCAAVLALAAAAITLAVAGGVPVFAPLFFFYGSPFALLGLLAFALLSLRWRLTLPRAAVAGFILPNLLLLPLLARPIADWSWEEAREILAVAALYGGGGAVGGAVFLIAIRSIPGGSSGTAALPFRQSVVRLAVLAVSTVAVALGILAVAAKPELLADRSCHNSRRHPEAPALWRLSASVRLGPGDWGELKDALSRFAADEGWSIRVRADDRGTNLRRFFFATLCTEPGTLIHVMQDIAAPGHPRSDVLTDAAVLINLYQPEGHESWREPTARLFRRLSERWPGRLRFGSDPQKDEPPPDWLTPTLPPDRAEPD
jgi:hypothetical protein